MNKETPRNQFRLFAGFFTVYFVWLAADVLRQSVLAKEEERLRLGRRVRYVEHLRRRVADDGVSSSPGARICRADDAG